MEGGVILTTYLTMKPDPQRKYRHRPDDPRKLSLAKDADRLGYPCYILYDELSGKFIREHRTENIGFYHVEQLPHLSCNDCRFAFYRYLLDVMERKPETVWCVDLFDVRMNRNPDFLILADPDYKLWVGASRRWSIDATTPDGNWAVRKLTNCYGEVPECCRSKPILWAGTWGGRYADVVEALESLRDEVAVVSKRHHNCNMGVFNKVMRERYGPDELWTKGPPLHSEFRARQVDAPVCFVHK